MITYRKDIDGLRSLAVLPVLLFHAGIPGFGGGFVGVDVFFVISGFLITSILLKDLSEDRFSIAVFYERRARRILPALAVVILFTIVVSHWLGIPTIQQGVSRSTIWLCGCSSNLYFKGEFGYFDADANTKPLLHTWSLSVEEQFYIFFPVLLYFGWKYGRQWLGLGLSTLVFLSFLASVLCLRSFPSATFYLFHFRSWELGLGSLLAFAYCPQTKYHLPQLGHRTSELLSCLGLGGILAPIFLYTSETAFPGFAALPPCFGTFLLIWANSDRTTTVGSWLSNKVLVTIGLCSYSLYLWHWPLLVFGMIRKGEPLNAWEGAWILGITCGVAWLSVKYVEKPFREKRVLKERRPMLLTSAATLIALAALNWNIASNHVLNEQQTMSALLDNPRRISCDFPELKIWELEPGISVYSLGNPQEPGVLMLGDSFADHWLTGLANWSKTNNLPIHVQAIGSVLPLKDSTAPGAEIMHNVAWKRRNASYDKLLDQLNIKHVILAASWDWYANPHRSLKDINTVIIEDRIPQSISEQREMLALQLEKTIQFFNAQGCKVWLMMPPPDYPFDVPLKLASLVRNETPISTSYMQVHRAEERRSSSCEFLRNAAAKFSTSQVEILDPIRYFLQDGYCVTAADGHSLYMDRWHLSYYGSLHAQHIFDSILEQPAPTTRSLEILANGTNGSKLR